MCHTFCFRFWLFSRINYMYICTSIISTVPLPLAATTIYYCFTAQENINSNNKWHCRSFGNRRNKIRLHLLVPRRPHRLVKKKLHLIDDRIRCYSFQGYNYLHKIKPTFLTLLSTDTLEDLYAFPCWRHSYFISNSPPLEPRIAALKVFAGQPPPRGSTNYIGPLPFKHRFALKISWSNWVRSCPRLKLPQRIIFNWGTFLRLYQTFGNLDQDLCAQQGSLRTKRDRHCHESGLDCDRIFSRWSWLQLPVKPSSRLFPRSEGSWGAAIPRIKSRIWLVVHLEDISTQGLNRLDEVECAIFRGTFNSNCIGSRIWSTAMLNLKFCQSLSASQKYRYITFSKTMEQSPFDRFGTPLKTLKFVITTYTSFLILKFSEQHRHISSRLYIPLFFNWSHLAGSWVLEQVVQVGSSWSVMAHLSSFLILGINAIPWLLSNRWSWAVSQGRTLIERFYLAFVVSMYEKPGSTCVPTLDVANTLNSSDKTSWRITIPH